MPPEPSAAGESTWFDDPESFEAEVRRALADPATAPPHIPGYESLARIGRGGQGVVYRARQRSTNRVVAIKVLAEGALASPLDRRRFEREVDLAASLRHPSIVDVHDSSVTPDGRPYLVMEHVEGRPIDEHLRARRDDARPDVRETVRLFVEVCDGVNHAHQRGVIHRDLKPSNIRVDEENRPRVLDFGLARLITPEVSETVLSTSGHFLGSLPYASPEQAAGRLHDIDIRADIYSLGVVLHELVTGRLPYNISGDLRSALTNIAETMPARLTNTNAGIDADLSTIVLRCLAKEPDRRYQTAGELAADLRHWLAGEPIQARRDSAWYTLRKRLVRYRLATAAALVILLVLAGALVAVNAFRVEAVRQRDEADAARKEAVAVTDFVEEAFTSVDPFASGATDRTVKSVLDLASADVARGFAGQPRTRAAVERLLGMIYWSLGELDRAATHLGDALALAERRHGSTYADAITLLINLAAVEMERERLDDARAMLDDAAERIEARIEAGSVEPSLVLQLDVNRALLLHYEGELDESEHSYRRVLDEQRATLGPDHPDTLETENNLAALLHTRGKYDDAIELAEHVHATRAARQGDDHPQSLLALQNLATYFSAAGQFEEALDAERRAIDGLTEVLGPRHPWTLNARANHAHTLEMTGRLDEAIRLNRDLIPLLIETYGERHDDTIRSMNNLATGLMRQDRFAEAQPVLENVVRLLTERYGERDFRALITRGNLGMAILEQGRLAEAEPILLKVQEACAEVFGPSHPRTLSARSNVATLRFQQERYDEALAIYREITTLAEGALPPGHWMSAVFRLGIGKCLFELGEPEAAARELEPAHVTLLESLGADNRHTREAGRYLRRLGIPADDTP